MDFVELRQQMLAMHPHCDFDCSLNFYYDETNNLRKFYLNDNAFNAPHDANFVLGGVVGCVPEIELEQLITEFNLQQNVGEVKFRHLANGDFLSVLKSNKLVALFEYLINSELLMHYFTVNFLYYSIVDIIDSAIIGSNRRDLIEHNHALKSIVYDVCKLELEQTISVFKYFKYPNLNVSSYDKFVYHLKKILNRHIKKYQEGIPVVMDILESSARNKSLIFISDETDYMLIEKFYHFYVQPTQVFKNSCHVIDNELQVISGFQQLKNSGTRFTNDKYTFADSKSSRYLQISDAVVGFVGKLTQFINVNDTQTIMKSIASLEQRQKKCLELYFRFYDKSMAVNHGFFYSVMSISDHRTLESLRDLALR